MSKTSHGVQSSPGLLPCFEAVPTRRHPHMMVVGKTIQFPIDTKLSNLSESMRQKVVRHIVYRCVIIIPS